MARPREFDTQQILQQVMGIFWERGYNQTSFAELEEKTGLKKGSLFAAYGNKQKLFIKALDCYHQESTKALEHIRTEAHTATEALRTWFLSAVCTKLHCPRGCLNVNTLIEFRENDEICTRQIEKHRQAIEKQLIETIAQGIEAKEFRKSLQPSLAAKYLMCVMCGLQVVSRAAKTPYRSKRTLHRILDLTLQGFT